jgi:O-succinylbenzoate synthase
MPGYSRDSLDDCREWLDTAIAGILTEPMAPVPPGPPEAGFALESALADLEARRAGLPLWERLGGVRRRIPAGAVIGLGTLPEDLPAAAESLARRGYRRIKLKIEPESAVGRVSAARSALPHHDLAVDANGSYDPAAPGPVDLDGFGLSFVEQPFPPDAWGSHVSAARSMATPICLDESITGVDSAVRAIETGAASIVAVKPARLGGIGAAMAVHDTVRDLGSNAWVGGMVESGIGKAAALAVATLPGMGLPADLPPSDRHFGTDPIDPPWLMEDGYLCLPDRPGLGVEPDPATVETVTLAVQRFGDVGWPR